MAQLILAENPLKPLNERFSRTRNTVLLCVFQECWSHAHLMDRVNLVEIHDATCRRIEEPGPLSVGALQFDQLQRASVGKRQCNLAPAPTAVYIGGQCQVGVGREGGKGAPDTHGSIQK